MRLKPPSSRFLRVSALLAPVDADFFVELCWDFNTAGLDETEVSDRVRFEAWFASSSIRADFRLQFQHEAARRQIEFQELRFDEIEDQPEIRLENQKRAFAGFAIDSHFYVHPVWEAPSPHHPINILMEPGHAFGTGSHESTQLCLRGMSDFLPHEGRFLDVGTGSGVLSIAAAKLRPRLQIFAMDNDRMAVEAARVNFAANRVSVAGLAAAELEAIRSRFDFIAANLTLEIFRSVVSSIAALAQGHVVVSGFTAEQGESVASLFQAAGKFQLRKRWTKNGWLGFLLEKKRGI